MSLINPYCLLGATVNSTRAEVKQAYHALSLIVHPDKGGCASDMIVLHNAYKYVIAQLSEVNHTVTVEELEGRFAEFCLQQVNQPPSFTQINVDMRAFHETFEALPRGDADGHALCASMTSGYDSFMARSEYRNRCGKLTYVPVDVQRAIARREADDWDAAWAGENESGDITMRIAKDREAKGSESPFQTQIMTYIEPDTTGTDTTLYYSEMNHADMLEDYGTECPFRMTDYQAAFNTTPEVLLDVSEGDVVQTYHELSLLRSHEIELQEHELHEHRLCAGAIKA